MHANIRGTAIYFDITGMQLAPTDKEFVERPVLFLLHGGPGGDHLRFKQHTAELADVAQLVFIDHRGCGRSKKTKAKDYTLENNIEDIEALRKHLGLGKICILGTSYGGMVAQGYATRYPQNIEKLILCATAPSYHFMAEAKAYMAKHATKKQLQLAEKLWQGKFKNVKEVNAYFDAMDGIYSTKARKKRVKKPFGTATVWSHEALNMGFGGFLRHYDFTPSLHKIKAPTLVLAGQNDWICSPAQSKIIAKNIPNATLKIFKNSGHVIAVDAHSGYIKSIKNFLERKKKPSARKKKKSS